jgi:AcrR family transcriptional regulator
VRQAILCATEQLLGDRRLDELTVLDVIEAASVSRATFYIYFESKKAAVAALAEAVIDEIYALWGPFMAGAERPSQALLTEHWSETLQLWRKHRAVLVAVAEAWRADPTSFNQWDAVWKRYAEVIREYIERARADWGAPTHLDSGSLATLLIWMNENALYRAFTESPGMVDDGRLAQTMSAIWMRSIFGSQPYE